jgi:hypothetical protein
MYIHGDSSEFPPSDDVTLTRQTSGINNVRSAWKDGKSNRLRGNTLYNGPGSRLCTVACVANYST